MAKQSISSLILPAVTLDYIRSYARACLIRGSLHQKAVILCFTIVRQLSGLITPALQTNYQGCARQLFNCFS